MTKVMSWVMCAIAAWSMSNPDAARAAECQPLKAKLNGKCNYARQCQKGHHSCSATQMPLDANGDCLIDSCQACPQGTHSADTDGDGCDDACVCCAPLECGKSQVGVDGDGDGCPDQCESEKALAKAAEKAEKQAAKALEKLHKPGGCTAKKLGLGQCPDCGIGTCIGGSYCDGPDCPNPRCYTPDSLMSLAMCGGFVDPCCGVGTCVGGAYCEGTHCDAPVCHLATEPISLVMCGGALQPNCGVGTCQKGGGYCDSCLCYPPESPVSQLFCSCHQTHCGEVTPGCGVGSCIKGAYCDGCVCYAPDSAISLTCCVVADTGVKTTFDQIYVPNGSNTGYHHAVAGLQTSDLGFLMVGGLNAGTVARTDAFGSLQWFMKVGSTWADVVEIGLGFVLAGIDGRLTRIDSAGNVVWSQKLAGAVYGLVVASNGDVVATGELGGQLFVARVDAAGTYLWGRTIGGVAADEGNSLIEQGSGFLILGNTSSFGAGGQDLWLVRIDAIGNVLWTKTFGGTGPEGSSYAIIGRQTVSPTSDGGALIATNSGSAPLTAEHAVVFKVDAVGSLDWANAYPLGSQSIASAAVEGQGGYRVFGSHIDEFQMGLGYGGDVLWTRSYGPDGYVNYLDGNVTADGGGVLFTESHHFPVSNPAHWFRLVKTDAEGRTHGCCDETNDTVAEVPLPFPLSFETGYSSAPLANPFVVEVLFSTPLMMKELTHCLSREDYLCGGVITGECPCTE